MTTRNGQQVISYNGETYNHQDLAAEIGLSDLRSRTDTEVVLRAFERCGTGSFERLNGIFAFAIYDRRERKLWLVRDRLGVKPLYYQHGSSQFVFASEIKAILAATCETASCNVGGLHEWLYYGNSLGGRTLCNNIAQLPPGCYLELDLRTFVARVCRYWTLASDAVKPDRHHTAGDAIAETRHRLEQAVRRQLMSDVPVGVFLSGGVDSSAIAAFAARHYGGKLSTFSAAFDDLTLPDERAIARRTAARLETNHHEVLITGADVPDLVEKLVQQHDGPFADAANIPLFQMTAQIRATTKVVLQGDGGDEVFGGYRRHTTLHQYWWLRRLAACARPLVALSPRTARQRRVFRYLHALTAPSVDETMARLLTADDPHDSPTAVFTQDVRREIERSDPFARYREIQKQVAAHDLVNQMLFVDQMVELPDVFLEKVDRAAMANGVEVRVPFLDNDLVGFASSIPGHIKMPHGRKKWLLKRALEGIVPDEVLHGPKIGFNVPFGYWLRTSLKEFFFAHLELFDRRHPGLLDVPHVRTVYGDYDRGRHDRSFLLWKVLNLAIWGNRTSVRFAAGR